MVQEINEFGKRGADDDGERASPKRRSGLHKFVRSSPPAPDIGAVRERYQKFVQSAFALKGVIAFQDLLQGGSSSGVHANEQKQRVAEFHSALPKVLADTPSLDNDQQGVVVEMACNTEKVADAGKAVNLAFKHVDDFKAAPQAMLLLNGIRSFANIQPDARTELFGHLSSAIGKGYLGKPHLDALNTGQLGTPTDISTSLSILAQELAPAVATLPDSKQRAPSRSWKTPKLDELPPEILQNIMLHAIEPDLRKGGPEGLYGALETTKAIGLTNKTLRAHAGELRLLEFNADFTNALPVASKRFGDFLMATDKLFAIEDNENFNPDDPRYGQALKDAVSASKKIFPVIKLMGEPEQSRMISTFCKFTQLGSVAHLMVAASEHAADFYPKSRSEMFTSLIQLLPQLPGDEDLQHRGRNQLAKAKLAGQLERGHYNAVAIADHADPGIHADIFDRIESLRQAASNLPTKVEPESPPLIPADAVIDDAVKKVVQGRQSLLQRIDDRVQSR